MHIKKYVFDNVLYTIMNVKGKTNCTENARRDLKLFCSRKDLYLIIKHTNRKIEITQGKYTLNKELASSS